MKNSEKRKRIIDTTEKIFCVLCGLGWALVVCWLFALIVGVGR